eukprot:6176497-Pleurochrysis_carterae.AAC.4
MPSPPATRLAMKVTTRYTSDDHQRAGRVDRWSGTGFVIDRAVEQQQPGPFHHEENVHVETAFRGRYGHEDAFVHAVDTDALDGVHPCCELRDRHRLVHRLARGGG